MSKTRVLMAIGRLVGGLLLLAAFAAVLLAATGLGAAEPPRRMPPPAAEAAPPVRRDPRLYREWPGTLGAYLTLEIQSRDEGTLLRRLHREGSFVRKGDHLLRPGERGRLRTPWTAP